ncbi:FadR/GntR family transcriptional regulator [Kineococcus sp. TBRC 1896]|uniref:FadR/GntR family transcriptional regulator n=1 Tax=Kineococcus mangrovi TaxID=1660183 RepID=A0ABV4I458_9ACTN
MTGPSSASRTHGSVLDTLGRRITCGDLPAGSVITLAGIEADTGTSRTVAREAVRVLESLGLVRSRRRVGITVQPRSSWHVLGAQTIRWTLDGPLRQTHLLELVELRAALEPAAARLAAGRADQAQRDGLVRLAEELVRLGSAGLGDSPEYLRVDIDFHALLLAASGNPLYAELAGPVREILVGRAERGLTPADPAPGTLDAHLAAARAIARGDGTDAERNVREHIAIVTGELHGA